MSFEIMENAPPPPPAKRGPSAAKRGPSAGSLNNAIRGMKVGSRLTVTGRAPKNVASQANLVARLSGDGRTYTTRVDGDNIYVWRMT